MDFSLLFLLAAFGGGLFGSAIGGQPAFIFTGFMVFIGIGVALSGSDYDFLGNVAFGPVFGPHISFGGAVAAAAYAGRMGEIDSGRDIASPIAGTGKPTALLIGGLFGMGAYLFQTLLNAILVVPQEDRAVREHVHRGERAGTVLSGRYPGLGHASAGYRAGHGARGRDRASRWLSRGEFRPGRPRYAGVLGEPRVRHRGGLAGHASVRVQRSGHAPHDPAGGARGGGGALGRRGSGGRDHRGGGRRGGGRAGCSGNCIRGCS